jgi:hypothetical protein
MLSFTYVYFCAISKLLTITAAADIFTELLYPRTLFYLWAVPTNEAEG